MKRLLCILLLPFFIFAFDVSTLKLTITNVDKKKQTLILKPNDGVLVGETGIIVHKIGPGLISNLITITDVSSDAIHATYERFKLLEQKYLPTPIMEPRVGDEVIMRSFYSRGFIVAPNQKLYEEIKARFPKIHFVSSDLMIADVGDKGIVDPSKKGFGEICRIYSAGVLMIYASNGLNILDCQSFKVLETQEMENPDPSSKQYPFFARVEAKSFWDFLRRKKEYFSEYNKLLNQ
ncbi:plasminogen-binding N-terminal domain-containing protein [Helicobacter pametensis]|uniref:plasminogen-binding N-terminal domain-containing protein n=1 Tax=Helicobacter pametensis TaxID=95149 RepID=UPI000CF1576B|nr:plasminogen-binding N-terminal domain-containing protein [Helicobacter pametensis]